MRGLVGGKSGLMSRAEGGFAEVRQEGRNGVKVEDKGISKVNLYSRRPGRLIIHELVHCSRRCPLARIWPTMVYCSLLELRLGPRTMCTSKP